MEIRCRKCHGKNVTYAEENMKGIKDLFLCHDCTIFFDDKLFSKFINELHYYYDMFLSEKVHVLYYSTDHLQEIENIIKKHNISTDAINITLLNGFYSYSIDGEKLLENQ